MTSEMTS